jgi:hypothetical protein
MAKERQRVPFRLIHTPCCHTLLCWVNARLPNYCPECGKHIYSKLKFGGILVEATDAWLDTEWSDEKTIAGTDP